MEYVRVASLVQGLVPNLILGGVSHLDYADDTMVMIEPTEEGIASHKFMLLWFENMPDIKIIFSKSEVVVLGVDHEEQRRVAYLLNCKLGVM
jgi:predicted transcriptional regulator